MVHKVYLPRSPTFASDKDDPELLKKMHHDMRLLRTRIQGASSVPLCTELRCVCMFVVKLYAQLADSRLSGDIRIWRRGLNGRVSAYSSSLIMNGTNHNRGGLVHPHFIL